MHSTLTRHIGRCVCITGEHMTTISHRKLCRGGGALTSLLIAAGLVLLVAFAGVRLVGLTPYAVLSGSMEPEYPVGSLVYVKAVDPLDVEVGDAITFSLPSGTLVTHQVYQIDAESRAFRTQGIANIASDGSISPTPRRCRTKTSWANPWHASRIWATSTNSSLLRWVL